MNDVGGRNFGINLRELLSGCATAVQLKHQLNQCALQPRSPTGVEQKAASRQFRASLEIHQPQSLAQLGMRFRHKVKMGFEQRRQPNFLIVCRRVPHRNALVWEVRKPEQNFVSSRLGLDDRLVEFRDFVSDLARLGLFRIGIRYRDKLRFCQFAIDPGMVPAHGTHANDCDLHAFLSMNSLTVATMVSRSEELNAGCTGSDSTSVG